jgi:hypothetical protein
MCISREVNCYAICSNVLHPSFGAIRLWSTIQIKLYTAENIIKIWITIYTDYLVAIIHSDALMLQSFSLQNPQYVITVSL